MTIVHIFRRIFYPLQFFYILSIIFEGPLHPGLPHSVAGWARFIPFRYPLFGYLFCNSINKSNKNKLEDNKQRSQFKYNEWSCSSLNNSSSISDGSQRITCQCESTVAHGFFCVVGFKKTTIQRQDDSVDTYYNNSSDKDNYYDNAHAHRALVCIGRTFVCISTESIAFPYLMVGDNKTKIDQTHVLQHCSRLDFRLVSQVLRNLLRRNHEPILRSAVGFTIAR